MEQMSKGTNPSLLIKEWYILWVPPSEGIWAHGVAEGIEVKRESFK